MKKKVKLPLRWIKGFSEVQAYQPHLNLKMEVGAADGLRFIRGLPKTAAPKQPSFAISNGGRFRLSQRPQSGAVRIQGTHRVRTIEPLLLRANKLRIWAVHRELPFDLNQVEELQPRLKNARKLVDTGPIIKLNSASSHTEYQVPGKETAHRVRLSDKGDRCTCAWFSKHQGARRPAGWLLML